MSKCVDDDFWPMLKFPPINLYSFPRRSLIVYTILSKPNCPQCQQAELMAKARGLEYEKKMLDVDYDMEYLKEVLKDAPQFKTFPIILKNGELVGGYREFALESNRFKTDRNFKTM